jgi:hypothetical protein
MNINHPFHVTERRQSQIACSKSPISRRIFGESLRDSSLILRQKAARDKGNRAGDQPIGARRVALLWRRAVVVIVMRHDGSLDTRKKRQL